MQHVVIYSSCNAKSLARDLAAMPSSFTARRVRLLDMFPQASHYEVMVQLERSQRADPAGRQRLLSAAP